MVESLGLLVTDIIFWVSILYIAGCVGLISRGDGSKKVSPSFPNGRPALIFNPMIWLRSKGKFYIRDHFFAGLFLTPLFTLPWLYVHGYTMWFALPYAIGFTLGGWKGWGEHFDMNDEGDYPGFFNRLLHYSILFLGVAVLAQMLQIGVPVINTLAAIAATLLYAFITPLIYRFTGNNLRFKAFTRYPTQYAEFFGNGVLLAILGFAMIFTIHLF